MKRAAVVLITLGIIALVVGFFPGLAGVAKPQPGFGPQQMTAVIIGGVLLVVGIVLACIRSCKSCAAKGVGGEAPKAEEKKVEG